MAQTLKYTIRNSSLVTLSQGMMVEGQDATVNFERTVIEADSNDPFEKTLTVVLPADALADFPEGSEITVTIEAAAPAADAAQQEA